MATKKKAADKKTGSRKKVPMRSQRSTKKTRTAAKNPTKKKKKTGIAAKALTKKKTGIAAKGPKKKGSSGAKTRTARKAGTTAKARVLKKANPHKKARKRLSKAKAEKAVARVEKAQRLELEKKKKAREAEKQRIKVRTQRKKDREKKAREEKKRAERERREEERSALIAERRREKEEAVHARAKLHEEKKRERARKKADEEKKRELARVAKMIERAEKLALKQEEKARKEREREEAKARKEREREEVKARKEREREEAKARAAELRERAAHAKRKEKELKHSLSLVAREQTKRWGAPLAELVSEFCNAFSRRSDVEVLRYEHDPLLELETLLSKSHELPLSGVLFLQTTGPLEFAWRLARAQESNLGGKISFGESASLGRFTNASGDVQPASHASPPATDDAFERQWLELISNAGAHREAEAVTLTTLLENSAPPFLSTSQLLSALGGDQEPNRAKKALLSLLGSSARLLVHASQTEEGRRRQSLLSGSRKCAPGDVDWPLLHELNAGTPVEKPEWARLVGDHERFLAEGGGGGRFCVEIDGGLPRASYRHPHLPLTELPKGQAHAPRENLESVSCQGVELPFANLCGVRAAKVSFARANLSSSLLSHSVLEGVNFRGANLSHCDLSACLLRGADFRGADLTETRFEAADLRAANFSGAQTIRTKFGGANVAGIKY